MFRIFVLCSLLCTLTGCMNRLSVQTKYITIEDLASYHVGTPDPCLQQSYIGQRLIISWYLPDEDLVYDELKLSLRVRFHNREEKHFYIPLAHETQGYYIFEILNEEFCTLQGILTYQAEILGDGCVLETWTHPLWVKLIKFKSPPS